MNLKMEENMKKIVLIILIISMGAVLIGCGETISGVSKDVSRMGRGVSTFFFRQ